MLLGDACSKCEYIAGVPLLPETAERLHRIYLERGARATTAIEGNTLSEEEVARLARGELDLPPSREYLGIEVRNILDACNDMLADLSNGSTLRLDADRVKALNGQVLHDLKMDDDAVAGEIRSHEVGAARYRGAPAKDCEYLLTRLCQWLNDMDFELGHSRLATPIVKAIVSHLYLAWIHPFSDGNGRSARLVECQILLNSGVPSPAAHLLSNHYNDTRSEYYRQLDRSSRVSYRTRRVPHLCLAGLRGRSVGPGRENKGADMAGHMDELRSCPVRRPRRRCRRQAQASVTRSVRV